MAGWLQSAARALGGGVAAPPAETPYEIVCGCGHAVRGMRRRTPQAPQCAGCGERVFVLPVDPYPSPRLKKTKPAVEATAPPTAPLVLEEELPDESDLPPAPPAVLAERKQRETPVRRAEPAAVASAATTQAAPPTPTLTVPRRRIVTPLRLLTLAILAIVMGTAALAWRSHRREQAETAIRSLVDPLDAALKDQDFAAAEPLLVELCAAADILGRTDPDSGRWRRLRRETEALNRRCLVPFFEMLRQADAATVDSDTAWESHFQAAFAGKWVIFDAPVRRTTAEAGEPRVLVELPALMGRGALAVEADLDAFRSLELDEEPRNLLFAAQLAACRLPRPDDPRFVVVLEPKSGFLWGEPETLAGSGLEGDGDDERRLVADRLRQQLANEPADPE